MPRPLLALLVVATLACPARAGALDDARAAARARELPALVELGTWCHQQKLFATRNALAERILALDPGHVGAHRWLRHRLGPGGRWEVAERSTPASDGAGTAAAIAEFPAVRTRLLGPIASALAEALQEHGADASPGTLEELRAEIVALAPDVAAYRAAHGELETAQGWRLAESVRGAARRAELRSAATQALAAVPEPTPFDVPSILQRNALRWRVALETAHVRVLATTTLPEAQRTATAVEALPAYVRTALGIDARHLPGYTVHALGGPDDANALLAVHPDVDARTREHWHSFSASWIGETNAIATYHPDARWRVESACAMALGVVLGTHYGIGPTRAPFAMDAVEKRLVWELVGTRVTFTRRVAEYADRAEEWAKVEELPDARWYARAAELLATLSEGDLAERMGRPLNALDLDDSVLGNALAAYYVEGRPDECGAFLRALGAGASPDDALRKASSLDLRALRLRMQRWLAERN